MNEITYPQHWCDRLLELGIRKFKYAELPDHMRDASLFRRAKEQGYIRSVGIYDIGKGNRKVWKVVR